MVIWNKNITGYNFMSYETINVNIKNKSSGSLRSLLYTSSYY